MIWTHAAAALLAAAMAATGAWKVQGWRFDAREKTRIEAEARDAARKVEHADTAAATHEVFKERERVVYQVITETVDRIVERPVYRNVCFDADGLRALGDAIHGRASDTGQPAPAVP